MSTTYYPRIVPENVIRLVDLALKPEDSHPAGVKWSGKGDIPEIGARVTIRMNELGPGRVSAYFVEPEPDNGYLGVKVELENPPAWHQRQNPGRPFALVFGAELAS